MLLMSLLVHPGDVRLVTAVDCPKLHHLYNVVVFSTRGQRDLPSMYVLVCISLLGCGN